MMLAKNRVLPSTAVRSYTKLVFPSKLSIYSSNFIEIFGCSPRAAYGTTDSRYRALITFTGWEELTGVYYVSGWSGNGEVCLMPDPEQGYVESSRRRAILAQKARKL